MKPLCRVRQKLPFLIFPSDDEVDALGVATLYVGLCVGWSDPTPRVRDSNVLNVRWAVLLQGGVMSVCIASSSQGASTQKLSQIPLGTSGSI